MTPPEGDRGSQRLGLDPSLHQVGQCGQMTGTIRGSGGSRGYGIWMPLRTQIWAMLAIEAAGSLL